MGRRDGRRPEQLTGRQRQRDDLAVVEAGEHHVAFHDRRAVSAQREARHRLLVVPRFHPVGDLEPAQAPVHGAHDDDAAGDRRRGEHFAAGRDLPALGAGLRVERDQLAARAADDDDALADRGPPGQVEVQRRAPDIATGREFERAHVTAVAGDIDTLALDHRLQAETQHVVPAFRPGAPDPVDAHRQDRSRRARRAARRPCPCRRPSPAPRLRPSPGFVSLPWVTPPALPRPVRRS